MWMVLIFPDHGSKYMTKVYSDEWMAEMGLLTVIMAKYKEAIII